MNPLDLALTQSSRALREDGVAWAIVGGLAVAVRAEPRLTRDVDFAVATRDDTDAESVVFGFVRRGYSAWRVLQRIEDGRLATVRMVAPLADPEGVVVDLLFAACGIEAEVVADATTEPFPDVGDLPVAARPHLVAMKVVSEDGLRRAQDRQDLLGLLRIASEAEVATARRLLHLVRDRGYDRSKDLDATLDRFLAAARAPSVDSGFEEVDPAQRFGPRR